MHTINYSSIHFNASLNVFFYSFIQHLLFHGFYTLIFRWFQVVGLDIFHSVGSDGKTWEVESATSEG
jgi:hypothetical protein